MKTIRNNVFDDKNISIFVMLNIVIDKWKIILFMAILSIPVSSIFYFNENNFFESNAVIILGKKYPTDTIFLEHPLILAKKIRVEINSNKNIVRGTVKTDNNAYYDRVRRTLTIKFIASSPEMAKKELALTINKILRSHYKKFLINKKTTESKNAVNTIVEVGPTYNPAPISTSSYRFFLNGIIISMIFSCFFILFRYRMLILK